MGEKCLKQYHTDYVCCKPSNITTLGQFSNCQIWDLSVSWSADTDAWHKLYNLEDDAYYKLYNPESDLCKLCYPETESCYKPYLLTTYLLI